MFIRIALTTLFAVLVSARARAADIFATFANHGTVVFNRTTTGFSGGGTVSAFTLGTKIFTNVAFTMTSLVVQGSPPISGGAEMNAGSFAFRDGSGIALLTATYTGARVISNGSWNTAFNASSIEGDNLIFGNVVGDQSNNGFSFALSPVIGVANSYNASFSAVGTVNPVPEPSSLVALGAGSLILIRRRRLRFR